MECSICGISGQMRNVVEVLSPTGLILACEKCALEEGFPILKKPDQKVFEEPQGKGSVYERMARLSGVRHSEPERYELKTQEERLRKIANRNYEEKIKKQDLNLKSRPDLVEKFHWIIMRVRRVRGLTQKQLAEMIGESEASIKMAEQGVVPEGYGLIDKLERLLRVKLVKDRASFMLNKIKERNSSASLDSNKDQKNSNIYETKEKNREISRSIQRKLSFDKQSLDSLTISDLQRMKKEREAKRLEDEEKNIPGDEESEEKEEP